MLRQRETKQNKTNFCWTKFVTTKDKTRKVCRGWDRPNWFRREAMSEAKADSETSSLELKASVSFLSTVEHQASPNLQFIMKNFITGRNVAQLASTSWGIISGKQPSTPLAGIRRRSGQLDTSLTHQQTSPVHLSQCNIRKSSLALRNKV